MLTLEEAKTWLRIDLDDEGFDSLIESLILTTTSDILESTGCPENFVDFIKPSGVNEIQNLYKNCQRIGVSDLFYERDTANKALNNFYTKLELAYRRNLAG